MKRDEQVIRTAVRGLAALIVLAFLVWPLDWVVWELRMLAGGGMGTVVVSHFTVAELKARKEDYYFEGSGPVDCSKSLFAHAGEGACWQLRRNPEVVVRY